MDKTQASSLKEPSDLRAIFFYGTIENNWLGHIMAEVYKDQIYRPFLPLQKEGTIALDIGANIGLVSIYLSKYFERIIALEPSFEHFDALNRNLQVNKVSNVKPIKKALFIKEGDFPFGGPKDNRTMRSLHAATWQGGKYDEIVQTITLDKLFEEEKIEHCDLLKIDIEGSEIEVFSGTGFKKVAPLIDTIIGERHKWSGRHPNQLNDALKSNGFEISGIQNDADIFVAKRK